MTAPKKRAKLEPVDNLEAGEPEPVEAPESTPPAPAEPDTVDFDYAGVTFRIPRDRDDWPMDAELALENQQWGLVARAVMGADQWNTLREVAPYRGGLFEFIRLFIKAAAEGCIN